MARAYHEIEHHLVRVFTAAGVNSVLGIILRIPIQIRPTAIPNAAGAHRVDRGYRAAAVEFADSTDAFFPETLTHWSNPHH